MSSKKNDADVLTVHPAFVESVPRLVLPFTLLVLIALAMLYVKDDFSMICLAIVGSLALLRVIVAASSKSIPRLILPVAVLVLSIVALISYKSDYAQTIDAAMGLIVLTCLLCMMLKAFVLTRFTSYVFTPEEVSSCTGMFHTTKSQVRVADIRGVTIRKTMWGRILGYASAEIGTAATGGSELKVENVRDLENILKARGITQSDA